jgi:hypothetical protein
MERRNNPKCGSVSVHQSSFSHILVVFSRLSRPCRDGEAQQPKVWVASATIPMIIVTYFRWSSVDYPAPAEMERRNNPKCGSASVHKGSFSHILVVFSRLSRPCRDGEALQPKVWVPSTTAPMIIVTYFDYHQLTIPPLLRWKGETTPSVSPLIIKALRASYALWLY